MVYVRREIFSANFRHVVADEIARRVSEKAQAPVEIHTRPWWKSLFDFSTHKRQDTPEATRSAESTQHERDRERGRPASSRLRPDMIRRMDDAPKLINPSGYISEGHTPQVSLNGVSMSPSAAARQIELERAEVQSAVDTVSEETEAELQREVEDGSEESVARQKYATGAYHVMSGS